MLCGTLDCDVKQTTTIPAGSDYYIEKEATWNVNACDHGRWRNAYTPSFADASAGAGRGRNVHTNTVPGPNHPTVLASRFTFTSLVAWLHQFSNLVTIHCWIPESHARGGHESFLQTPRRLVHSANQHLAGGRRPPVFVYLPLPNQNLQAGHHGTPTPAHSVERATSARACTYADSSCSAGHLITYRHAENAYKTGGRVRGLVGVSYISVPFNDRHMYLRNTTPGPLLLIERMKTTWQPNHIYARAYPTIMEVRSMTKGGGEQKPNRYDTVYL